MKRGLRNHIIITITTLAIIRSHRNGPPKAKMLAAARLEEREVVPTTLLDRLLGNSLAVVWEEILAEATEREPGHRRATQLQHRGEEGPPAAWMSLRRRAVCPGTCTHHIDLLRFFSPFFLCWRMSLSAADKEHETPARTLTRLSQKLIHARRDVNADETPSVFIFGF